jgi:hypothetical protein
MKREIPHLPLKREKYMILKKPDNTVILPGSGKY